MLPTIRHALAGAALLAVAAATASAAAPDLPAQTTPAAPLVASPPFALTPGTTAFVDVSVVPMDGERLLAHQTVLVRDGRIAAVGPTATVRVPKDAARIDGRGKFLMPGLVEMHAHFAPGPGLPTDPAGRQLSLLLANGVTTTRGLIAPPNYLALRERVRRGEVLGPELLVAGPSVNGQSAPTPADAVRLVTEARGAGYDLIKTHGGLTREAYDSMIATARRLGLRVVGHVTQGYGLAHAMASGQQVEHLDGYLAALWRDGATTPAPDDQIIADPAALANVDTAKLSALAADTRRLGVWNGLTLFLFQRIVGPESLEALAAEPEMRYVPPKTLETWTSMTRQVRASPDGGAGAAHFLDLRDGVARALYAAGARLLVSSDSPQFFMVPGFATHQEMEAMARAGIPTYAVLAAATRNPAEYLERAAEHGTVAVGRTADLLLLEANPLADVRNTRRIAGVMARGRWLPADALARMLAAVEAGAHTT